jgi:hypothetical protein
MYIHEPKANKNQTDVIMQLETFKLDWW